MAGVELRAYQRAAVEAVLAARRDGVRRMVLALPTGAGKTIVFAELARRARHPVLVLAHRDELVRQAHARIAAVLREDANDSREVAIEQGDHRSSRDAAILVASIRSLHDRRIGTALAGRGIRLVIYDECHHAIADDNRRVLEQIGAFADDWPGTLVGATATTRRADGRGLDEVFERIVYHRSLREMIDEGWLRPLVGMRIATGVDISDVAIRGDDFDETALAARIDVEARNHLVARSIQELARGRRTIAFCIGIHHAERLSGALRKLGVRAGMVCGEMPKPDRMRVLDRFRRGELEVVTNVGVLTEGFDDPGVSAIAMVRPTRSEAVYLQCVGRGMRTHPDASDCLVLDFVDLSGVEVMTTATLDAGRGVPPEERAGESTTGMAAIPVDDDDDEPPATLAEIEARLARFDPLVPSVREETAAISVNAWISLGARGLMLHFVDHVGALQYFAVRAEGRGAAAVWLGDRRIARVSSLWDAIAAVDDELARHGEPASARADASWRTAPCPDDLRGQLAGLCPARIVNNVGEALAHLALAEALASFAGPGRGRDQVARPLPASKAGSASPITRR